MIEDIDNHSEIVSPQTDFNRFDNSHKSSIDISPTRNKLLNSSSNNSGNGNGSGSGESNQE